jgi:FkbM family methyltransferase
MKTLIEVGAYDGTDSIRYNSQGFRVFTFEPKKDLYNALVAKTRHLTHYTVSPKAVCLHNGKTQFNICKYGGASSILPFRTNDELAKHWTPKRDDVQYSGISYEVETTRLDTFIEENNLQETVIDYLHIDAQGVDLDVLKSLGIYIKNVHAGVVETVKQVEKSIYVGQDNNTVDTVSQFLHENGFIINRIDSNDSTQCEFNVVFSRAE